MLDLEATPMHGNMLRWMNSRYAARKESVRTFGGKIAGRVRHVVLPWVWGDGRQIIGLRPTATNLGCYMIAGHSAWHLNDDGGFWAYLDEIKELIEDQFGLCGCEQCAFDPDDSDPKYDVYKAWPTPCFSVGCRWFREEIRNG